MKLIFKNKLLKKYSFYLILLFLFFLILRYLLLIKSYSANVLIGDQWDFFNPLFYEKSIWDIYNYLHSPHKQGIGFVIFSFIHKLSSWNLKLEVYLIFSLLTLVSFLFLFLKKKIFGKLNLFDIILPLIILSLNSFESMISVSNPSHGITPLLLLTLFCISIQYNFFSGVSILGALMIHSGFGIMIFPVTIFILIIQLIQNKKNYLKMIQFIFYILINFIFLYLFLFDYPKKINAANTCFEFPHVHPIQYVHFLSFQSLGIFNIYSLDEGLYLLGFFYFLLLICIILNNTFKIFSNLFQLKKMNPKNFILLSLCSFTVLFCLNTAIGRVCSSIYMGQSSRYYLYLIPGLIGVYFFLTEIKSIILKLIVLGLLIYSSFNFKNRLDLASIKKISETKLIWRKCILETDNIDLCQTKTHKDFVIYPNPKATNMRWKLDYLKRNKLNIYSD